ncbi:hypothetical protein BH11ACT8_BH11ACT8_27680 [soil metagenome]
MGSMSDEGTEEAGGLRHKLREVKGLPERVARLEADMVEARQLHVRVAELTDLVAELLVPLAKLDPEGAVAILERYQDELGS